MRAILSAPGSRGDVNPMIAIGKRLRSQGHEVVISLAEPYIEVARDAGLQAEPVISREDFSEALGNPEVWKPIKGPLRVFRSAVQDFLGRHEEVIRRYVDPGQTILVAHPLDLASRVYRDANPDVPLVSVQLQPVILRTLDSPPRLSPWWFEVSGPRWLMRSAYWLVDRFAVDRVICPPLNEMRSRYRLAPIQRPLNWWWHSPDKTLAFYPDWFAPATRNFLPSMVHCGFPLQDHAVESFEPPSNAPIVFTAGTAHHHCRDFFEKAVATCSELGRPGLLLSTFKENFPSDLPKEVQALRYVSFGQLLPHCSAIVHHGGIGTTSQGFAAGIPQVIRPLAFDQFDNAQRVERLGCGKWLHRDRDLSATLEDLLGHKNLTASSVLGEIATELNSTDSIGVAATQIEQLGRAKGLA